MRAPALFPCGLLYFALILAPPLRAEPQIPPVVEPGRYAMTAAEGGFLRLDTLTGAVSLCSAKDGRPACRTGADDVAALESEVSRLQQENGELRNKLADSAAQAPALPDDEAFERTLSFAERFMRRMMKIVREQSPGDKP